MGQARTERKRAEKAANREAKAAKKEAHVVEDKKRRLSNGWLALLIFGIVALMFASVWGYKYFSKEASIESYIANNGGEKTYSNVMLTPERSLNVTADKNNMKIEINVTAEKGSDDAKYYKTDEGEEEMKYVAAYYMGTIEPLVRGNSATADVVAKVNGKELNSVTVDWSEADEILQKYGMSVETIQQQVAEQKAQEKAQEEAAAAAAAESEDTEAPAEADGEAEE